MSEATGTWSQGGAPDGGVRLFLSLDISGRCQRPICSLIAYTTIESITFLLFDNMVHAILWDFDFILAFGNRVHRPSWRHTKTFACTLVHLVCRTGFQAHLLGSPGTRKSVLHDMTSVVATSHHLSPCGMTSHDRPVYFLQNLVELAVQHGYE